MSAIDEGLLLEGIIGATRPGLRKVEKSGESGSVDVNLAVRTEFVTRLPESERVNVEPRATLTEKWRSHAARQNSDRPDR